MERPHRLWRGFFDRIGDGEKTGKLLINGNVYDRASLLLQSVSLVVQRCKVTHALFFQ